MSKRKKIISFVYKKVSSMKKTSLLIAILLAAFLAPGMKSLKMVVGPEVWFEKDAPILKELDEFSRTFGNDETVVIALHTEKGDVFTPKTIKAVQKLTDELYEVEDVIRVESISNYNHIDAVEDEIIIVPLFDDEAQYTQPQLDQKRNTVKKTDELMGKMISKDLKTTLIFTHMKPYFKGHPNHTVIHQQVEKLKDKYQSEDYRILISGSVPVAAIGKKISMADISLYSPLFLLMVILLLYFYFRSLGGVVIPLIVISLTLMTTFGIMGHMNLKFNMLTFITPLALMAIAIADSIHFISAFYRSRMKEDKEEALKHSFGKNFYPTLVTSLTTAFGFFSLATVELIPIRTLGLVSGMGTLIAWVISILVVIPLLSYMDSKGRNSHSLQLSKESISTIVDFIFENKYKVLSGFTITILLAVLMSSRTQVNFNFFKSLKEDVSVSQANDFLLKELGGVGGPEIVIDSGKDNGAKDPAFLMKVDQFSKWILDRKEVNSVGSVTDVVKKMNKIINGNQESFKIIPAKKETVAELLFLYTMGLPEGTNINHLISLNQRKLRMSVLWNIQDAVESKIHMNEIKSYADSIGLNIFISGKIKLYQKINDTIVSSLVKSMAIALFAITLFISLILRSIKMGLFSLIPNMIPLIYGGASLYLLGNYIDSGVVVVLSVCLGIAVDDTIHFLTHFIQGKKDNLPLKQNIKEIFHGTGNALIITTVILFFGFGLFGFSNYIPNSNFGILSSIILSSALILDLFLLPTLIIISDKFLGSKTIESAAHSPIGDCNELQRQ